MKALVSILVTTYNLENYVESAIRSALAQTYKKIQIIVVDDNSSDRTWRIIEQFKYKIIAVRHKQRQFISAALNTALNYATGSYYLRLDGDDKMYPTLVEEEVRYLKQHLDVDYIYCDYHMVDIFGKKVKKTKLLEYSPENLYHVDMTAVGTMMRKKIFDSGVKFDPEMHLQEMYEFYLRVLRQYKGVYIPKKLWAYTRRPGQATSEQQRLRFIKYTLLAIQKNLSAEFRNITF